MLNKHGNAITNLFEVSLKESINGQIYCAYQAIDLYPYRDYTHEEINKIKQVIYTRAQMQMDKMIRLEIKKGRIT